MNPPASLRQDHCALTGERALGMVFANTPDGPYVVHLPLAWTCEDAVHFHLARLLLIKSSDECANAAEGPQVQEWAAIAWHRRRLAS